MMQPWQKNGSILQLSSKGWSWDKSRWLQGMKEMQLHVLTDMLIKWVENSKKFVIDIPIYFTATHTWMNIYGKHRWMRSWCRLTDPRWWFLTDRIWAGYKLHLQMLLLFFMAPLRIRFIIIIHRNHEKSLLFIAFVWIFIKDGLLSVNIWHNFFPARRAS